MSSFILDDVLELKGPLSIQQQLFTIAFNPTFIKALKQGIQRQKINQLIQDLNAEILANERQFAQGVQTGFRRGTVELFGQGDNLILFNDPSVPINERIVVTTNVIKFVREDATKDQLKEIRTKLLESKGAILKENASRTEIANVLVNGQRIGKNGKLKLKNGPFRSSDNLVSIVNRKNIENSVVSLSTNLEDLNDPGKIVVPQSPGFTVSIFGKSRRKFNVNLSEGMHLFNVEEIPQDTRTKRDIVPFFKQFEDVDRITQIEEVWDKPKIDNTIISEIINDVNTPRSPVQKRAKEIVRFEREQKLGSIDPNIAARIIIEDEDTDFDDILDGPPSGTVENVPRETDEEGKQIRKQERKEKKRRKERRKKKRRKEKQIKDIEDLDFDDDTEFDRVESAIDKLFSNISFTLQNKVSKSGLSSQITGINNNVIKGSETVKQIFLSKVKDKLKSREIGHAEKAQHILDAFKQSKR
jgi:hypothetical protein